jgi:tetratricopeptide (TPR) repeat protein
VKIAPKRPDLHAALGECYFTDGKIDKAFEEFRSLIRLDPSARSDAFMGLCYRDLGRFDEARKYLEQGLKLELRSAACLYNLGYIASRQGNYNAAEKYLERALQASPDYDDARLELAGVKMHQKKFDQAIPLLRKYAQSNPNPAPAYYKLAAAERNLHQTDAAERDLKIFQTLSKDPKSGPYPFQHLFDYLDQRAGIPTPQQSRIDLEQLRQELKIHPDRPQNLYLLAQGYLELGRVDEAKQAVGHLDQLIGGDFRTSVGVGALLARCHLYPEAIEHFQAALKANPNSDDAWFDLADAYFRARQFPDALAAIKNISPSGEKEWSYQFLLGDVYAHLGQTAEAVDLFRRVIRANPDKEQAHLSLALTYLRSGTTQQAGRALQDGLSRVPDSGELFWGWGFWRRWRGEPNKRSFT